MTCTTEKEGGSGVQSTKAIVTPDDSAFGELSQLSLRRLLRDEANEQAWADPEEWIRGQLIVDIDEVSKALTDLANNPDNPLGGPELTSAVQAAISTLRNWSRLALHGCDPVQAKENRVRLRCEWSAASLALYVQVLLVEAGEARYAINIRTMNKSRLQHLEAIANSFEPR